jgi:hypothetical protein
VRETKEMAVKLREFHSKFEGITHRHWCCVVVAIGCSSHAWVESICGVCAQRRKSASTWIAWRQSKRPQRQRNSSSNPKNAKQKLPPPLRLLLPRPNLPLPLPPPQSLLQMLRRRGMTALVSILTLSCPIGGPAECGGSRNLFFCCSSQARMGCARAVRVSAVQPQLSSKQYVCS